MHKTRIHNVTVLEERRRSGRDEENNSKERRATQPDMNLFHSDYCTARNFRQEFNFVAFVRAIF